MLRTTRAAVPKATQPRARIAVSAVESVSAPSAVRAPGGSTLSPSGRRQATSCRTRPGSTPSARISRRPLTWPESAELLRPRQRDDQPTGRSIGARPEDLHATESNPAARPPGFNGAARVRPSESARAGSSNAQSPSSPPAPATRARSRRLDTQNGNRNVARTPRSRRHPEPAGRRTARGDRSEGHRHIRVEPAQVGRRDFQ